MAVRIRPAETADSPIAVDIVHAVYDEFDFSWDAEEYHADLYDLGGYYFEKGHRFWIGELDAEPVGTIGLELFPEVAGDVGTVVGIAGKLRVAGCDCSLDRMYVRREARRSGVGSALISTLLGEARACGRKAVEIWSDKRFEDAHRLYRKFGARVVGERICHDPDQSPEWGLLLSLAERAS